MPVNRTAMLWRISGWTWLVISGAVGVVGMANLYRDSAPIRIPEFSSIYESIGLNDAVMITAVLVVPLAGALLAAAVILARRGDEPAAVLMATGLVSIYLFASGASLGVSNSTVATAVAAGSMVLVVLFLSTFPTGRFTPRWSVAAPALSSLLLVVRPRLALNARSILTDPQSLGAVDKATGALAWAVMLAIIVGAQVVRYRRYATVSERLQTRWVMTALAWMLTPPIVLLAMLALDTAPPAAVGWLVLAAVVGSLAVPAAVSVAVFRYHLYEIDRILSRTVMYLLVALTVSSVYVLLVVTLPLALGASSDLVVAASTLAAAGAFGFARRRIQKAVDHRFNRARYDAQREVDRFSARLNASAGLDNLAADLLLVVGRTLAPADSSLWVREADAGQAGQRVSGIPL